jgi:neutral ceramidase
VDPALPVLRLVASDGTVIAVIVAYACHPVVLGADNLLWTADYPGFVRLALERHHPGAVALFLTGCTGDANTGHKVVASSTLAPQAERSFAAAECIGERIAAMALAAPARRMEGAVAANSTTLALSLVARETAPPDALARQWRKELATATAGQAAALHTFIDWAETIATRELTPWPARVTVLRWCGVRIIALPGEIFAATALRIRGSLDGPTVTIAYADGVPGYLPPADEYAHGGYEVDEAHRFYGMPAAFAPGCAERLADVAIALARV